LKRARGKGGVGVGASTGGRGDTGESVGIEVGVEEVGKKGKKVRWGDVEVRIFDQEEGG
jgi:hypothetical protein